MLVLPPPVSRKPIHTRRMMFEAYARDDGLCDIECELLDTKPFGVYRLERGLQPPEAPIHWFRVRLTVDDDFTIRDVQTASQAVPFPECHAAAEEPMRKLIGLKMSSGWRKAIEGAIGGVAGCTHLRELVFNAATPAFQAIPFYRATQGGTRPVPEPGAGSDKPPFYMGQCMSWSFEGTVMKRLAPRFYRPPGTDKETK